jgi:dihydroorotate dehydrogenase
MTKKDLSITFLGVKFPNPFCLSASPVGNCYDMCAKAYDVGWGGVVFKTIGFFIADEVSPRSIKSEKRAPRSSVLRIWSRSRSIPLKTTFATSNA